MPDQNMLLSRLQKYVKNMLEYTIEHKDDKSIEDALKHAKQQARRDVAVSFSSDLTIVHVGKRVSGFLEGVRAGAVSSLGRVYEFEAVLGGPGLVGASGGPLELVFEVGLSWDLFLDVPYLPGSGVKGAVRGFWESLLLAGEEDPRSVDEMRARACLCEGLDGSFRFLFGSSCRSQVLGFGEEFARGSLVFFDAYPVGVEGGDGRLLEPYVITPHYYEGGKVKRFEAEAESVPILHLVLRRGVRFRFLVGVHDVSASREEAERILSCVNSGDARGAGRVLDPLVALVAVPLFKGGVGARTSRGMGFFQLRSARVYGGL